MNVDHMYQLAYRGAYRLMRTYWGLRHPHTHGALVALWNEGRILLVKNSYLHYFSVPGGYVRRGETGKQAAARELREEVGLSISEADLTLVADVHHAWEGKQDHVEIFRANLPYAPKVAIDNREVLSAQLYTPEEALRLELFPPIRQHIADVRAKTS